MDGGREGFWRGVCVWVVKPGVVNKKIRQSHVVGVFRRRRRGGRGVGEEGKEEEEIDEETVWDEGGMRRCVKESLCVDLDAVDAFRQAVERDMGVELVPKEGGKEGEWDVEQLVESGRVGMEGDYHYLVGVVHSPKDFKRYAKVLSFAGLDPVKNTVNVWSFSLEGALSKEYVPSMRRYEFALVENGSSMEMAFRVWWDGEGAEKETERGQTNWLMRCVLPKISKWAASGGGNDGEYRRKRAALAEINALRYVELYNELKEKYGRKIEGIWTETTDPKKFVYEDVAIASYLICLWERERLEKSFEKRQSFIDLGCGNGLLVYILNNEGHPGKGVDLRPRRIWEKYNSISNVPVTLSVESVIPQEDAKVGIEYDWLIGNHSDELTPWIPVMANNTSKDTRFFVLPCCFFDFFGKFSSNDMRLGQYETYLNHIRGIGEMCGFEILTDSLKIPSTKRICHIGMRKVFNEDESWKRECERVREFIRGKQKSFVPREKVEAVRNCTHVDADLRERMVSVMAKHLLDSGASDGEWRAGGVVKLSELSKLFSSADLKRLKSECGGLQTLLRNQHQVFLVKAGAAQLRDWRKEDQRPKRTNKEAPLKVKICWFYEHHPDGCPLSRDECPFAHGEEDLLGKEAKKRKI
eukprot:Nk52_evm71s224 gene=Nk52_evmTU71s224